MFNDKMQYKSSIMRIKTLAISVLALWSVALTCGAKTLKEAYRDYWRMGMSVNQWEVGIDGSTPSNLPITGFTGRDQTVDFPIIASHFGWVVAENCMKIEAIHPEEGVYDFTLADQFVNKALANGLHVVGHCLIWHSQCPDWFFVDKDGKQVTADVLKQRMRDHIFTILGHFRGKVEAWDVVNEAFEDDGTLRRSKFYEILGEDFIPLAFQYAHEADPTIELYYNDYSMNKPGKVRAVVDFFKPLMAKGMPLTSIGMQGHLILGEEDYVSQYEKSIQTIYNELGVPAQFTELDLSVLPNPYGFAGANISDNFKYSEKMDPYRDRLPESVQKKADDFWLNFFTMLMRNKERVLRVGFWCFNAGNSWRNDFPIRGRCDYATLFTRDNTPKPTIKKLIQLVEKQKKD